MTQIYFGYASRFLVAAALMTALAVLPVRADILEQILVKVNGEIITKTDLEERQIQALRQRNIRFSDDDAQLKKLIEEITPQLIVETIDELLLVQRGRELGYAMNDEQFKRILENIKKENKIENEEQFQAALKQEGLTMSDLRKSLERRMLIERVQQTEVLQRVGINEEEARAYYDAHPQEFTSEAGFTLREILITVPSDVKEGQAGVNVARDDEAKERAEAIRKRIVGGEDFATVAAEASDAPSKANGGLVGPIARSELAPALVEILDKLQLGEVSQPIRSARGYQLLKLETKTEAAPRSFEAVRDEIAEKVYNQKRRGELEKYLKKLRAAAIIEWKNDQLRKIYEQQIGRVTPAAPAL